MAKKFTDLTVLATVEDDDLIAVDEDSSGLTKSVTAEVLRNYTGRQVRANHVDGAAVISETSFDIDTPADSTWESVGPTGSGADNIWTALDGVPTDADWIIVRSTLNAAGTAVAETATASVEVYARETGSAEVASALTRIQLAACYGNAESVATVQNITEITIPVSSSVVFDIYVDQNNISTSLHAMYVVGYGRNAA